MQLPSREFPGKFSLPPPVALDFYSTVIFYPEQTHRAGQNSDSTDICHQSAVNPTFNTSKPGVYPS